MSHINDSYVKIDKSCNITSYIGSDATHYFEAKVILSCIKACKNGFRMTRNATPKKMLGRATDFTRKKYKMGQYDEAIRDMELWIAAMALALPVVYEEDMQDV